MPIDSVVMRVSTLAFPLLFGTLTACDGGGPGAVGAPCNAEEDCDSGLICDVHNDQGSCQEPHGHTAGETEETASEASTTEHSHDTEGHHETEGHHDTEAGSTSEGTTSDATATEGSTSTGVGETTGDDTLCLAFCGCMQTTCSGYEAYPYADDAACMTACEAFDEATLQCFGGFCQQAMETEGTLAEHYCEHAWGDLGNQKC